MGFSQRLQAWLLQRGTTRERWAGPALMYLRDLLQTPFHSRPVEMLPASVRDPIQRADHRWRSRRVAQEQNQLKQIVSQNEGVIPSIIFPPGLSWEKQLFQRPQQLARALARQGALVFYMEAPSANNPTPFQMEIERLFLSRVPVETFWVLETPVVYTLTWTLARYWLAFDAPRLVYDYVDSLDVFSGNRLELRRNHTHLLKKAAMVLATAQRLLAQVKDLRPDVIYCPNGCDYEHFARARQSCSEPPPDDIAKILEFGKPVIGYHGVMARWFDTDLLLRLADQNKDFSFVLIGPDHDGILGSTALLSRSNIHWLGEKSYLELPDYLRCFDAAMIPFKLDEITHATSPVKLFEYMAAGKPIVTTPMQESSLYPGVLIGENAPEFTARLIEAQQLKLSPAYLELLDRTALANTWDVRARQILDILKKDS
jgi:glycosyltransferase involved in cell wall biosynthesis